MHKLLIQDDEGKTTVVPLIRDEITIGRKEGNTIRLTERNVSRKHARIVRNNGTIAIEDLGSYNGVKVNGSRIQGRVGIALSDRIQIGDYLLELKLDNAPATIGVQPTVPINSVAPPPVAVAPAVPVAQEEAPTTKISDEVMREVGHASLPPAAQPVPPAASSPSLPPAVEPSVAPSQAPGAIPVQPQAAPKQTGRMVVLSRNFAGREYVLDRPALVIGRTEDNDVVINHRSISRHHAKVVLENGRYAIVDMQSSNGVRVNGEEYGKVELRRGDIIDLGHVRIRFVEPGESFVFTPSMAVDVGSGGGGKTLWFVLAAVLVGAAGIGVFALTGGDDEGDKEEKPLPAVTVRDAGPTSEKPASPDKPIDNDELLQALEKAEKANNDKKWAAAKKAAEQALAIEPGNDKATALAEQAARELDNLERFDELKKLSKVRRNKNYARIAEAFTEITVESVYKDDARKLHDAAKTKYSDATKQRAKQLVRGKKCDQLRTLASEAEQIWEDVGALVEPEVERCEAAVVARRPTERRPPDRTNDNDTNDTTNNKKPEQTTNNDTANNTPRKPRKSFKEYMSEAETAAKSGQYGVALRACRNALKLRSSDMQALTTCAVASCRLKRADAAKRYINRISANKRRGMLKQVCLRNGVEIP